MEELVVVQQVTEGPKSKNPNLKVDAVWLVEYKIPFLDTSCLA